MVEHAGTARHVVAVENPPFAVEFDDLSGARVVCREVEIGADLLGIRRVANRQVSRPNQGSAGRVFAYP